MSKFLKFTNFMVNSNDIHKIVIKPDKYYIHIVSKKMDGFIWNIGGFGIGNITSCTSEIEVCKTLYPSDYKIVTDWIEQN